jgi:hypothetical protein
MTKQKALRLRTGQRITFGDSMWTRDVHHWRSGTVIRVTPRGGILIDTGSGEEWVPYHHVASVEPKGRTQ